MKFYLEGWQSMALCGVNQIYEIMFSWGPPERGNKSDNHPILQPAKSSRSGSALVFAYIEGIDPNILAD